MQLLGEEFISNNEEVHDFLPFSIDKFSVTKEDPAGGQSAMYVWSRNLVIINKIEIDRDNMTETEYINAEWWLFQVGVWFMIKFDFEWRMTKMQKVLVRNDINVETILKTFVFKMWQIINDTYISYKLSHYSDYNWVLDLTQKAKEHIYNVTRELKWAKYFEKIS